MAMGAFLATMSFVVGQRLDTCFQTHDDMCYEEVRDWPIRKMSSSNVTKVVLLCCGSFNPITNMHLRLFELARDSLQRTGKYRVVGGFISPVNDAYGKKDLEPASHRCAMLKLALKTTDWISLDTWECNQDRWQESLKVLRHCRELTESLFNANQTSDTPTKKRKIDPGISADEVDHSIPTSFHLNEPGPVQVKLLCGADLLESFAVPGLWKDADIEEIVGRFGIVCVSRLGSDARKFIYDTDVLYRHQNNIHLVTEWIPNDISSTRIRKALRRSESVKYLLQDSVIEYIQSHNLYGAADK